MEKHRLIPRTISRSSRLELLCIKGVFRNFGKFTGKHLCQSVFFNKVAGLGPATLLKKRCWPRCFPVNVAKFLSKNNFFKNTSWQLLLYLLHVRVMLTIVKVFIILFLLVRIGNILAIFKINQ